MKPDFGFHIPGVKGLFDYDEIVRRTQLPKRNPDGTLNQEHIKTPAVLEMETTRGQRLGKIPWHIAAIKFR